MGKISNVITMIQLLNNGRKYSIKELADILEVSPRMIRIYKDTIEQSGIYIDTIRGKYGGYVLNHQYKLPNRNFNQADIILLKNIPINTNYNQEKLKLLIDKIEGIYKAYSIPRTALNNYDKEKYNVISRASNEKRKLNIDYISGDKTIKTRIIHPKDLFSSEKGWYVVGFCELRNDIRSFELDRIVDYNLLTEKF